jgi:serine/threonine-protein kinase
MSATGSAKLPGPGGLVDGKYLLERLLGQGGMGAVYAARHVKLGHAVAIKLMLAATGDADATRRFLNEGRAAVNIQHENVVRGSDLGEENGYAFMVLELLDGEDLDQLLEREIRLEPQVAVSYVIQALRGVGQAHALGIVHRDLKPANLFLARRPDGSRIIKVLDFGISKASKGALDLAPGQQTSTAAMIGSPLYMSPEQLRSSKTVDARTDIWAIGVILFELMSGERPFNGETLGELFSAILETEAPRLSARFPSIPEGLDAIIARCLRRRPEERYGSAAELERDLAPFAAAGFPMLASSLASTSHVQPHHPPAPNTGAMAGSSPSIGGAASGVVTGAGPVGGMSPSSFQHTTGSGGAWQRAMPPPAKMSTGLVAFLLVCGFLAVSGGGLFAYSRLHKPGGPQPVAAASAPVAPVSGAVPAQTAALVALPAQTESAASAAAASVEAVSTPASSAALDAGAPTVKRRPAGAPGIAPAEPPKAEPPKAEPPKAEPPKAEPPKAVIPAPRPVVTASPQQNSR